MEEHFEGFDGRIGVAHEEVQRAVADVVDGDNACLGHHGEKRA